MMISYCWAEKALCKKIFDNLHTGGYRVWFDEINMHGNTVSTMATAIKSSQSIIICMSENYEKSNACHHEADFAYVQQRRIIPLVVQSKYKPREWLAFIIGSSLYVDFIKYEFNQAYGMLEKEIKMLSKPLTSTSDSNKPIKQDDTPKRQVTNTHENKRVDEWTSDDVFSWCHSHNLSTFVQLLEHYDGLSLLQLHNMSKSRTDEEIFRLLQDDYEQIRQKTSAKLTFTEYVRFQTVLNQRLTKDLPQHQTLPAKKTRICSIF